MPEISTRRSLRGVNLNLLPILGGLLTHRSVTITAEQLHMSQSAVSDALARLRTQFRDELLVRSGRQMVLTPLAHELAAPVGEVLSRVEALVDVPEFDPMLLEREFIIATADPVVMTIGGSLFRRLQTDAPNVSVRFVELSGADHERLGSLQLDLVIVPRGFISQRRFQEAPLYEEPFVCICRRDHPDVPGRITRAVYSKLPHVSYRVDAGAEAGMDTQLMGMAQNDVVMVPSFSLLPLLVEQTDAIALVQKRVAERFKASAAIEIHPTPVPTPPLEVCMYWSAGHEQDRAHQWLRNCLSSLEIDE